LSGPNGAAMAEEKQIKITIIDGQLTKGKKKRKGARQKMGALVFPMAGGEAGRRRAGTLE